MSFDDAATRGSSPSRSGILASGADMDVLEIRTEARLLAARSALDLDWGRSTATKPSSNGLVVTIGRAMETPDDEFRLRAMSGDGSDLLPELLVIKPQVYADARGDFFESFNAQGFAQTVESGFEFVQDNHSRSAQHVLRGLHYQIDPHAQGKLVRMVRGAVFDVAVDIRRSSPTFGNWFGVELSEDNFKQLWVPPGFAHGFLALTDPAELLYKVTDYYSPEHDRSIRWDDPDIGIEWPIDGEPILSEKDASAPYLAEAEVFA